MGRIGTWSSVVRVSLGCAAALSLLGGCSEDGGAKDPSLAYLDTTGTAPADGVSPESDADPNAGKDILAADGAVDDITPVTPDVDDDANVEPQPDASEPTDSDSPLGPCVDPATHACAICVSDDDCAGGRCLTIDGELHCAPVCTLDTDCANGFGCVSTGEGAAAELTCQPISQTCSCCEAEQGTTRNCFGPAGQVPECAGVSTCDAASGWSSCVISSPSPETCDGKDNDCDGKVDEDYTDGAGAFTSDDHCGGCNTSCVTFADHGVSVCGTSTGAPSCEIVACDFGYRLEAGQCAIGPATGATCAACSTDADCLDGKCVTLDGSTVCLPSCGPAACPDSLVCSQVDGASLCAPPSGTCSCTSATDGLARSCSNATAAGVCAGTETCHAATGWGACSAALAVSETCDGLDNDCNGSIDDGPLMASGGSCTSDVAGVGSCAGSRRCGGTQGWVCDGQIPAVEACNGADDDCDGQVDEGFRDGAGLYVTNDHCGACGNSCVGQILHGTAKCVAGGGAARCVVDSCDAGYLASGETACAEPPSLSCAACNGDEDCGGGSCVPLAGALVCVMPCDATGGCTDAATVCTDLAEGGALMRCVPSSGACTCDDLNAGLERSCKVGSALGTCTGREVCEPATGWVGCSAATPAAEACNGLDDDCDGVIDDGLPIGDACAITVTGVGVCSGTAFCQGVLGWTCVGQSPTLDVCDQLDNDCDGLTDEVFTDAAGLYRSDTNCGVCGNDCTTAIVGGVGRCGGPIDAPVCVVSACDVGLVPVSAFACGTAVVPTCEACGSDADCGGSSAVCASVAGSPVCLPTCSPGGAACPEGFACGATNNGTACLPLSGSCDCSIVTTGASRSCAVSTTSGTCRGSQTCGGASGWSVCTASVPAAETCNGFDDDCSGVIDDGLTPPGPSCSVSNGFGTCVGAWTCEVGWFCGAAVPAPERCDDIDNNCDGATDEGFVDSATGLLLGDHHCGTCDIDCVSGIPNGAGTCVNDGGVAVCTVVSCAPGYVQSGQSACAPIRVDCAPCTTDSDCHGSGDRCLTIDGRGICGTDCSDGNVYASIAGSCHDGFTCAPVGGGSLCLPTSGSCDCLPSHAGTTRGCSVQNVAGTCSGSETCDPSQGFVGCSALTPAAETCNGVDDDCSGVTDDGIMGPPCSEQAGVCAGAAASCGGSGGWSACSAAEYGPDFEAVESICDGLDNDCDGQVDEGFVTGAGAYATDAACGSCANDCTALVGVANGHGYGRCAVAGAPSCELVCCSPGDTNPACDGRTWSNENGDPADGCETSPCVSDLECGAQKFCFNGKCTQNASGGPCDADINCPDGQTCVGGFCGCAGSLFSATKVPPNVLIVLDRSGSMTNKIGNQTKWQIAKTAVGNLLTKFGAEARFGLMLYPGTNKSGSAGKLCSSGAVFVDTADSTAATITTFLSGAGTSPYGTPTAATLANVATYAGLTDKTRDNYVLIITDGKSTCNNSPVNEVAALLAKTPSIKTFVVGFGSGVSPTELDAMASAGGVPRAGGPPFYYQADSAADLDTALATIGGTVLSCSYALDQVPTNIADLFVFFDGAKQLQDPAHLTGWDYAAPTNTLSFYGNACSSLKSGTVKSLVMVYGCSGVIQ